MSRRIRFIGAVAAAAALGGGSLAIAQSDQKTEPDQFQRRLATPAEDARARGAFEAFGKEELAVRDPGLVALAAPQGRTLDPSLVRLVRRDSDHKVYLLAGPSTLCMTVLEESGGGGTECAMSRQEIAAKAAGSTGAGISWLSDGYRVTALLADGSRDAVLEMPGGRSREASAVNNVVSVEVDDAPTAFAWTAPDGSRQRYEFMDITR